MRHCQHHVQRHCTKHSNPAALALATLLQQHGPFHRVRKFEFGEAKGLLYTIYIHTIYSIIYIHYIYIYTIYTIYYMYISLSLPHTKTPFILVIYIYINPHWWQIIFCLPGLLKSMLPRGLGNLRVRKPQIWILGGDFRWLLDFRWWIIEQSISLGGELLNFRSTITFFLG